MKCCAEYAALLDPFVDGELPAEDMARVADHLAGCPACQDYVDDALAIRAAFPDVEETQVPEGFAEAVCAAIRADAAPRKRQVPRRAWASLAACCALVLLLSRLPITSRNLTAATADTTAEDVTSHAAAPAMSGTDDAASDDSCDIAMYDAGDAPEESTPEAQDLPENGAINDHEAVRIAPSTAAEEEADAFTSSKTSDADTGGPTAEQDEGWVEHGNVVFSCVVYLPADVVGDALEGYEGKPYSNVNQPEEGVIGTGYALEQADFEHILYDVLDYPLGPILNQERTTELCCIVVTDAADASTAEP